MQRFAVILGLIFIAVLTGLTILNAGEDTEADVSANAVLLAAPTQDLSAYQRAIEPYSWQFPIDHGPHPEFQTEWWYYTGNVSTETGRHFGYQFTIFRRTTTPETYTSGSEWRTNQLYMAHLTVTDAAGEAFYRYQRFSRDSADLAGATSETQYHIWLENWGVRALNDDATLTRLTATERDLEHDIALNLTLKQVKPLTLQGDNGLSPKSDVPGEASYYYSASRLDTAGIITIDGESFTVSGASWMDHEFSSGAMADDTQGWDWFGLHLDDNRELMIGQLRRLGSDEPTLYGGSLIRADGTVQHLQLGDFTIDVTDTWTSPHSGATYPAGWVITVDIGEAEPLTLTVKPLIADQELTESVLVYWEGAVQISGDADGFGYAELTGYHAPMQNRF